MADPKTLREVAAHLDRYGPESSAKCERCAGRGTIAFATEDESCPACHGTGRIDAPEQPAEGHRRA